MPSTDPSFIQLDESPSSSGSSVRIVDQPQQQASSHAITVAIKRTEPDMNLSQLLDQLDNEDTEQPPHAKEIVSKLTPAVSQSVPPPSLPPASPSFQPSTSYPNSYTHNSIPQAASAPLPANSQECGMQIDNAHSQPPVGANAGTWKMEESHNALPSSFDVAGPEAPDVQQMVDQHEDAAEALQDELSLSLPLQSQTTSHIGDSIAAPSSTNALTNFLQVPALTSTHSNLSPAFSASSSSMCGSSIIDFASIPMSICETSQLQEPEPVASKAPIPVDNPLDAHTVSVSPMNSLQISPQPPSASPVLSPDLHSPLKSPAKSFESPLIAAESPIKTNQPSPARRSLSFETTSNRLAVAPVSAQLSSSLPLPLPLANESEVEFEVTPPTREIISASAAATCSAIPMTDSQPVDRAAIKADVTSVISSSVPITSVYASVFDSPSRSRSCSFPSSPASVSLPLPLTSTIVPRSILSQPKVTSDVRPMKLLVRRSVRFNLPHSHTQEVEDVSQSSPQKRRQPKYVGKKAALLRAINSAHFEETATSFSSMHVSSSAAAAAFEVPASLDGLQNSCSQASCYQAAYSPLDLYLEAESQSQQHSQLFDSPTKMPMLPLSQTYDNPPIEQVVQQSTAPVKPMNSNVAASNVLAVVAQATDVNVIPEHAAAEVMAVASPSPVAVAALSGGASQTVIILDESISAYSQVFDEAYVEPYMQMDEETFVKNQTAKIEETKQEFATAAEAAESPLTASPPPFLAPIVVEDSPQPIEVNIDASRSTLKTEQSSKHTEAVEIVRASGETVAERKGDDAAASSASNIKRPLSPEPYMPSISMDEVEDLTLTPSFSPPLALTVALKSETRKPVKQELAAAEKPFPTIASAIKATEANTTSPSRPHIHKYKRPRLHKIEKKRLLAEQKVAAAAAAAAAASTVSPKLPMTLGGIDNRMSSDVEQMDDIENVEEELKQDQVKLQTSKQQSKPKETKTVVAQSLKGHTSFDRSDEVKEEREEKEISDIDSLSGSPIIISKPAAKSSSSKKRARSEQKEEDAKVERVNKKLKQKQTTSEKNVATSDKNETTKPEAAASSAPSTGKQTSLSSFFTRPANSAPITAPPFSSTAFISSKRTYAPSAIGEDNAGVIPLVAASKKQKTKDKTTAKLQQYETINLIDD